MKSIGLKGKLISAFLLSGLLPLIFISTYSYIKTSSVLRKEAIDKLTAVRSIKGEAVKRYFNTIKSQIITFSDSVSIQNAMIDFSQSFKSFSTDIQATDEDFSIYKSKVQEYYINEFGKKYENENGKSINTKEFLEKLTNEEIALQYYYIAANQNPLGSKEKLTYSLDGSEYSDDHRKYHSSIKHFLEEFGYYDIFLVDVNSGNIVYSVFKELDFATSLIKGPYNNTNFAKAFEAAKKINTENEFVIVDYQKYTPSFEAPASFIAAPIWKDAIKIGVAIFQMPIDRLNTIMSERTGMGETGETYLFGQDHLMRSDSFLDNKNFNVVESFKNPSRAKLSAQYISDALEGKSGNILTKNYLNQEVISTYTPINILGLKWGLVAEKNTEEAFSSVISIRDTLFTIVIISIFAIIILSYFISNTLAQKIHSVAKKLLGRTEEVANSSEGISSSSIELSRATDKQAESLQTTVSAIDEINSMVSRNADSARKSTEVSLQSNNAATKGKATVESMIKSISEISESNNEIANEMHKNNEDISQIVKVISEIGEKTNVINDIVFQTKLLSFNASVEAARAGEHGKGFAVVAEEVGNLASMSGKAALEITELLDSSIKQVTDIVDNTKVKVDKLITTSKEKVSLGTKTAYECGDALDEILLNVSSVNNSVQEISSASEEQSIGVQEVTEAMQELDQTTHQNTSIANESSKMAERLKSQADGVNDSVNELMEIVSGTKKRNNIYDSKGIHDSIKEDNKSVQSAPSTNITVSTKESTPDDENKKNSNSDLGVPDESDSRFEDL